MLNIKNLEKLIEVPGCSVQVKRVQMTDRNHPQRTYDIVFQHRDRPDREFFLTIDREGRHLHMLDTMEYPISFWELTGPHNQSTDVKVWEKNLQTSKLFLDFLDTIIQHYTT
jgi:hypothetical protein